MEKQELLTIVTMMRHATNQANSPAVRAWAIAAGKRALLTWSIIRVSVI